MRRNLKKKKMKMKNFSRKKGGKFMVRSQNELKQVLIFCWSKMSNSPTSFDFEPGCHSFYGKMKARVLEGSCLVQGYLIKPTDFDYEFYSPISNIPLQFISQDKFKLLITPIPNINESDPSKTNIAFYLFPIFQINNGKTLVDFKELCPGVYFSDKYQNLSYNEEDIKYIDENTRDTTIFFITGDTGSGKSTFTRFLTNHLLNKYEYVNYIDCDPGQSEFYLPRTLGITYVNSPIFKPPEIYKTYEQRITPFGYLSIKDIDQYIEHIEKALRLIKKGYPVVVNSLGFVHKFGVLIHKALFQVIRPNISILLSREGLRDPLDELFNRCKPIKIKNAPVSLNISPIQKREMRYVSYFCRNQLASTQQPKSIKLDSIYFYLQNKEVPLSELFTYCVGLVCFFIRDKSIYSAKEEEKEREKTSFVKVIRSDMPPKSICGAGLIRGVDLSEKLLYINTPDDVSSIKIIFIPSSEFVSSLLTDYPKYPAFCALGTDFKMG